MVKDNKTIKVSSGAVSVSGGNVGITNDSGEWIPEMMSYQAKRAKTFGGEVYYGCTEEGEQENKYGVLRFET